MHNNQESVHICSPLSFFEVVLFDQPSGFFTYHYHIALCIGTIVQVPFGTQHRYALIVRILENKPQVSYTIKSCMSVIAQSWLSAKEMHFLSFAARYYHADLCDVLKCFCPKSFLDRIVKNSTNISEDPVLPTDSQLAPSLPQSFGLNESQKKVVQSIALNSFSRHLIYGVTGSGKTRTYLHIAAEALKQGNVLYLVPEIHLATTLALSIEQSLGFKPLVYHSLISPKKREECLHVLRQTSKGLVVIAARSGVFLSLKNLSLVIIDEEHDPAYKNYEGRFRYHARDLAIYKSQIYDCPCVLGSATPTPKWFDDQQGQIHTLLERATGYAPPVIELKSVNVPTFEMPLDWTVLEEIKMVLERQEQVLIFLNQKGYAPRLYCQSCKESALCPSCHAPMTVHDHLLICHHCGGGTKKFQSTCPTCNGNRTLLGFGLDRLYEFLKEVFPDEKVIQIDKHSAGTAKAFEHQVQQIQTHQRAIIIGTQMISKGYDWPKVTLCVILIASFQIRHFLNPSLVQQIFQTAGRSGRHAVGRVICPVAHQDFSDERDLKAILEPTNYRTYCQNYEMEKSLEPQFFAKISYRTNRLDDLLKALRNILKLFPKNTTLGPMLDYPPKKNTSWNVIWYLHTSSRSQREVLLVELENTFHQQNPLLKKAFLSIDIDPLLSF